MCKCRSFLLVILLFVLATGIRAQNFFGDWSDHLPYQRVIAVADAGDRVYAASESGLFYYNRTDGSIRKLSKVQGLSDVGISDINFEPASKTLVIAYSNANIDIIRDGKIINIPDLRRKQMLGNKTINKIEFINGKTFLACGFGILMLDLERKEFPDPIYYIGPEGSAVNVLDIAFDDASGNIFAATEAGIFRAPVNSPNLAYFAYWTRDNENLPDGRYNHLAALNGKVYTNRKSAAYSQDEMYVREGASWKPFYTEVKNTRFNMDVYHGKLVVSQTLSVDVYKPDGTLDYRLYAYAPGTGNPVNPLDALLDRDGHLWIGDEFRSLVHVENIWTVPDYLKPAGPEYPGIFDMDIVQNSLWTVRGGRTSSYGGVYNYPAISSFTNGSWNVLDETDIPEWKDYRDLVSVAINPANPRQVFAGTWGYGLFEFAEQRFVTRYTPENSSLQVSILDGRSVFVGGLAFDAQGNLWMTNSLAPKLLSVRKANGNWQAFNLAPEAAGVDLGKIMIDTRGYKWMLMRDFTLLVFDDNRTLEQTGDDRVKRLTRIPGSGAIPGNRTLSMTTDKEGYVWVGTDNGVGVFYRPENIFTGENFDAARPVVREGEIGSYLLMGEIVTSIAVDGSNQKWFGTERSGVFLMSEEGTELIRHFTVENSPLISNHIIDIGITESGEVFFATDRGLVSYRSEFTEPPAKLDSAYVFPNPVRETYNGNIYIRNLVEGANVKITDISGNIVNSVDAKGGQAAWNGKNFDGIRVKTGVYLLFISNPDATETKVIKLMFIN